MLITNNRELPIGATLVRKYYADSYADMAYSHGRRFDSFEDAAEVARRRYWKRWIAAGRPQRQDEGCEPTVDLRYVFEDKDGVEYGVLFWRKAVSRFGLGAPDELTETEVPVML